MALTKEQFREWAKAQGWTPDQYGHLQREWAPGERGNQKPERYRYKITKVAVRLEIRVGDRWVRLRSGYFGKLNIRPDQSLEGMKSK